MLKQIRNGLQKLKAKEVKKAHLGAPLAAKPVAAGQDYFQVAQSWADDVYTSMTISRNRYQMAFFAMALLCVCLVIGMVTLLPLQHTALVVVHEGSGGHIWLSTVTSHDNVPVNWARTEAEIAHYVQVRASYDPSLYQDEAKEVNLLSSPEVQLQYALSQSSRHPHAPVHLLGDKGYRTVIVHNVLPLDSVSQNKNGINTHVNLAQVNYTVIDHWFGEDQTTQTPYTALVSWRYAGIPHNPEKLLHDWDGFLVTKFMIQPVNVGQSASTTH